MSEFSFDYKCISMNSKENIEGKSDKALGFYLYQNYSKGLMQVQVYIPKNISREYAAVGVYKDINSLEIPKYDMNKCDLYYCQDVSNVGNNAKYLSEDGCIFIDPQIPSNGDLNNAELSGSGVIAFYKKRNKKGEIAARPEDYDPETSVNVEPDEQDCYKYVINFFKKDIIFYRIIETKRKISIQVIYPLIRKDIKLNLIYKEGSKPIIIKDRNVFENAKTHEPIQVVLKHTNRLREVITKTVSAPTDGFDYRLSFDDEDNNKYYLLSDESEFTVEDKKRIQRYKKYSENRKITKDKSITVTTVGFPNTGKTIFLASVFNYKMIDDRIEADPFILNSIIKYFSKVGSIKTKNKAKEIRISLDESGFTEDDIKARYNLRVGDNIESSTSTGDKKTNYPIGFMLPGLGKMYFYDVPGELFKNNNMEINRNAYNADCFIALIDGDKQDGGGAKSALSDLKQALSRLNGSQDKPIAIVFTKHDKMLKEYVNENSQVAINSCFDENCHVVKENMLELMPKNHKYKGSLLERHINDSSYELEHYLKGLNNSSEGKNTFEDIISGYKNIKFFTCSALGNDQCLSADASGGRKEILFRPRRLRMELPIIWLMYQCGLIRR